MKTTDISPEAEYRLTNTNTGELAYKPVTLSASEVWTLNYAYALNKSEMKYIKEDESCAFAS